jgi:hypothetical protein
MLAALVVLASLAIGDTVAPVVDTAVAAPVVDAGPRLDVLYREPFAPLTLTPGREAGRLTPFAADTGRPKAIEYSSGYYTRLKIHQIASWTMLPLFVTQYLVGQDLIENGNQASSFSKDAHAPLAAAIAGVFAVQAVTGVWNLVDSWKDPAGGTRRKVHSIAMLVASAGFVATAATAPELEDDGNYAFESEGDANTHKALAIGSMALATASWLMMLIWKD